MFRNAHQIVFAIQHTKAQIDHNLVHLADEVVDELLAITKISTLNEVLELADAESTGGGGQLEGPQEVGSLLEVGTNGEDLVDEILNGDDAELAELGLNDRVVGLKGILAKERYRM